MSLAESSISTQLEEFLICPVSPIDDRQVKLNRDDDKSLIPLEHFVAYGGKLSTVFYTVWGRNDLYTLLRTSVQKAYEANMLYMQFYELWQRHIELTVHYETIAELFESEIGMVPEALSREIEYIFATLLYSGVVSINDKEEFLTLRGSVPKNAILRPKGIIGTRGRDIYSKWTALRFAFQVIGKTDLLKMAGYENLFSNAARNQDLDIMFTFNAGYSWQEFLKVLGINEGCSKEEKGIVYEVLKRTHLNGKTPVVMVYITLTHKESGKAITLDFSEEIHDPHDLRVGDRAPRYDRDLVIQVVHHEERIQIKIKKKLLRGLLEDNNFKKRTSCLTDEVSRALRTLVDTSFYNPAAAMAGTPLESGEMCEEAAQNIDHFIGRGEKLEGRRVEKEIIKDVLRIIMLQGKNAYYTFQDLHLLRLFPFGSRNADEVMEIFELVQSFDRLAAEMILNPSLVVEILNLCDPRLTH